MAIARGVTIAVNVVMVAIAVIIPDPTIAAAPAPIIAAIDDSYLGPSPEEDRND